MGWCSEAVTPKGPWTMDNTCYSRSVCYTVSTGWERARGGCEASRTHARYAIQPDPHSRGEGHGYIQKSKEKSEEAPPKTSHAFGLTMPPVSARQCRTSEHSVPICTW